MTDEALVIRVKRVLNEVNKRPSLDLFFRINPLLQEYKNTTTESNDPKLIEFSKKTFKDKEDFISEFKKVTA